ncbi:hypothetical protein B0H14DRAFT_2623538 [Mycena olivaceomarginata]|nr:hypothetical protein B0H14DRAFT_2623538 [Mycena olivaceomarginata]
MCIGQVLSTLLTASAVWGHPNLDDGILLGFFNAFFLNNIQVHTSTSDQFTAASAKATFFMNGNNWDCIYDTDHISDVKSGVTLGLTTLSMAQIQDMMFRMKEAFLHILGIKLVFMHPPYRSYNSNIQLITAARG